MHGTHVMDIAAGNGRAGGPAGVAPEADLVFVHLADSGTGGLANLGDSVRLLEAVDFVRRTAAERPWVVNVSVGRHGRPARRRDAGRARVRRAARGGARPLHRAERGQLPPVRDARVAACSSRGSRGR